MERVGLVSRVEEDLERAIALGLFQRDGFLPSEQVLARQQGVSRATAREALLRLAARGLVVQHPGRRSRAVPLSEAVTLENLSVMLHGEERAHPDRLRLLDGYFSLKRDTMVELLAACCEQASQEELSRLEDACFALQGTGPWEEQRRWMEREFELLRLAAIVANRPGQLLLVRSLERAFWGMAGRLLSHLNCQAVREWAWAAYHALGERDVQALRRNLPSLLHAADAPLIANLAPAVESSHEPEVGVPGATKPNPSACPTSSGRVPPTDALSPAPEAGAPSAVSANWSASHTASCQMPPAGDPSLAPETGGRGSGEANRSACPTGLCQSPSVGAPSHESKAGAPGAVWPNRSACLTGSCQSQQTGEACCRTGRAVGGAHVWSPAPWALASSPEGDEAVPPGPMKSAPSWHGRYFDDTQGCSPFQVGCAAAEMHHARRARGTSWPAVIELRWG
jgi:DNA-binding FadR family transcriptional regulator